MTLLNIQKKTMWIPLVNYINIFLFLINSKKMALFSRSWWMSYVYFFGFAIGSHMACSFVGSLLPQEPPVGGIFYLYFFPLIICYGLIKYQEKYLNL